ncbi:MAG: ATP-binding protein [Candidatus Marinimicrobia bacterium]|nr:ATP-binding protein [Candidatus Neomarinimicrobiota bacterium]
MTQEEIIKEYEKKLKFPKTNPEVQIMICPIGTVASGKTTIIKPLSKKLSLLKISTDEIRKLFKENGHGYDSVKDLAYKLADKYIGKGFSIAVDADCNSNGAQEKIKKLQEKYKIKVFWIHIKPPEEFIINKLKSYKHTWLFRDANHAIENYKSSKEGHKNINFNFIYTFDTSRDDLDKQIEECIDVIKENH